MGNKRGLALLVAVLLATTGAAQANSTTATSLTVEGRPIPGKVINIHAIVTGKHFVYAGGCSLYSGEVYLYQGPDIIAGDFPTTYNSNVTLGQATYVPESPGACYQESTGLYYVWKYYGDYTDIVFSYRLPAGAADFTFSARFAGDQDANGSTSSTVNVRARYPSNAAVIDYILSN